MAQKTGLKTVTTIFLICAMLTVIICSYRGAAMPAVPDKGCGTRDAASFVAEQFVKNDATFKFDGMKDTFSLRVENAGSLPDVVRSKFTAMTLGIPMASTDYKFKAKFDSAHSGFGDRNGKYLAQVVTPHEAEITISGCQVTSAVMDGKWDMLSQKMIE